MMHLSPLFFLQENRFSPLPAAGFFWVFGFFCLSLVCHWLVTDYRKRRSPSMRWLGKGRTGSEKSMQGVEFNVWNKDYNDTSTGTTWVYPEFKGYHDKVYWAELQTSTLPLSFINHNDDIALRMFTPKKAAPGEATAPKSTKVQFPLGDISLLPTIGPIGDKFPQI